MSFKRCAAARRGTYATARSASSVTMTGWPLRRSDSSAASIAATTSRPRYACESGVAPVRMHRAKSCSSSASGSAGSRRGATMSPLR